MKTHPDNRFYFIQPVIFIQIHDFLTEYITVTKKKKCFYYILIQEIQFNSKNQSIWNN